MSGSNADQNVSGLHENVGRKFAEVRNSSSTESACSTTNKSKGDSNSECDGLHDDTAVRELRMNSNSEWKDRAKTAFSTPASHFEFLRIPMGLKSTPSTFQSLMNSVLAGMNGLRCSCYMDDVIIIADSLD
jgi:hypothetical protein